MLFNIKCLDNKITKKNKIRKSKQPFKWLASQLKYERILQNKESIVDILTNESSSYIYSFFEALPKRLEQECINKAQITKGGTKRGKELF